MSEHSKVVGVTFDGRQPIIAEINELADELIAIREPENPHDNNAIALFIEKPNGERQSVGYINRGLAAQLAPRMDAGENLMILDYFVTGKNYDGSTLGIIFSYDMMKEAIAK